MNYSGILDQIHRDLKPWLGTGRVADYIPELANTSADRFGMAVVPIAGGVLFTGESHTRFSIPSSSKLFSCTHAFKMIVDAAWQRVCPLTSGTPFNSVVE